MLIVGVSVGLRHDPGCYGVMEVEKGEGLGLGHHGNQKCKSKGKGKGMGKGKGKKDLRLRRALPRGTRAWAMTGARRTRAWAGVCWL